MEWISVNERLPDNHKLVLVHVSRHNYYANYISTSHRQNNVWVSEEGTWRTITHWMPLPPPPSSGNSE